MRMGSEKGGARWLCGLSVAAVFVGAFGVTTALPSAAEAQTPQSDSAAATNDEEVVITARRRSERLQDVPVAITALTGAQMDQYAVTSVSDLARFVPSMVVGRAASGSAANIFLRGVGSSSLSAGFDQSVSFNIDGMSMSRGREILFSQYDVQHIEVLKGPQALYFGKNTTGGLISITTNNPSSDFEANARVGYGFEGEETYADGVISGPLGDQLAARLAIHVDRAEGWFDNSAQPGVDTLQQTLDPSHTFARAPLSDRRGGNDSASGRLTLVYDPSSRLHFNLKLGGSTYTDNNAGDLYERICGGGRTTPLPTVQPFFNTTPIVDPYADCSINGVSDHASLPSEAVTGPTGLRWAKDGRPYTDFDSYFGILTGEYRFDALSVSSITTYYNFEQADLIDYNGMVRTVSTSQLAKLHQFSEELRFQTQFAGPVNFMFGAFYGTSTFEFDNDAYIYAVPFDPVLQTYVNYRRNAGFDGDSYSVFAEGTWNVLPTLELSGGARWTREEKDSYEQSLPAAAALAANFPGNIRLDDNYAEENISPEATLRWKPTPYITAYVGYKEGFKAGGFNLSQALTPSASVAKGRFGSEGARGWEAGIRTTLFDRRLQLNLTAYDYEFRNLQVQFYNQAALAQVVANAGELDTKGIEGDFNWLVPSVEGLSVHGAIAYNNAKYGDFIGQCYGGQDEAHGCDQRFAGGVFNGQIFSGRTPPKAPELGAQLGAGYEFPVSGDLRGVLTTDVNYSSKYNFTDTLRPDAWQDAFARVDASFALTNDARGWRFSVIGRNLTDELVVSSANDIVGTAGPNQHTGATIASGVPGVVADMNAIVERGREIYVELGLKF